MLVLFYWHADLQSVVVSMNMNISLLQCFSPSVHFVSDTEIFCMEIF